MEEKPKNNVYNQDVIIMGGGIAGTLTALELANKGFKVKIIERRSDVMLATSASNAARENTGLHYPKDFETGMKVMERSAYFHLLLPGFRRTQDTDPVSGRITPIAGTQYFVTSNPDEQHVNEEQVRNATEALKQGYADLTKRFPKLLEIYGKPEELFTELTAHKCNFPHNTCYGVQSQDKFFDINNLAASITEAVENHPNIEVYTNHSITDIAHEQDGKFNVTCKDSDGKEVHFIGDQVVNNTWTNASLLDSKLTMRQISYPPMTAYHPPDNTTSFTNAPANDLGEYASSSTVSSYSSANEQILAPNSSTLVKDQYIRLKGMLILKVPDDFVIDGPKFVISKNGAALIPLPTPGLIALIGGESSILDKVAGKGEPERWGAVLNKNITPANIAQVEDETGLKLQDFADEVLQKGKDLFHLPPETEICRIVTGTIATEDKDITTRKSDIFRPISFEVPGYVSVVTDKFYNGPTVAVATAQMVEQNAYKLANLPVPASLRKDLNELVSDTIAERERTGEYPVQPIESPGRVRDFCVRHKRLNSGSLSEAIFNAKS
ncbi:MAG: FAD-dependent oxidoreductase [Rickettsiales bacterium]|nr:FAD-dependent oxidoreductase [Rickettsiales bacterium]